MNTLDNSIQIIFENLTEDKILFLKQGIKKNTCLICNKRPSFENINEKVFIRNICCEKYAKLINDSVDIRNINNYASEFRGKFLNEFCFLEAFVDYIIDSHCVLLNLKSNEILGKDVDDIGLREKKILLNVCLEYYQKETNLDISKIWGNFNNLIKTRNVLAHWEVDVSEKGLELLKNKKEIRFVNKKLMEIINTMNFNSKKVSDNVLKIKKLTSEMIVIYKFYRNNETY